jgi:hypothetical protein
LVDRTPPARGRLALRCAASLGCLLLLCLAAALLISTPSAAGSRLDPDPLPATITRVNRPAFSDPITNTLVITHHTYLPLLSGQGSPAFPCPISSATTWAEMSPMQSLIAGAALSPDLNMHVRGWRPVEASLGFARYPYPPGEPPDTLHPLHLSNIAGSTGASFASAYQVNDWDWLGCNCAVPRSGPPYPVTMLGLRTTPGQALRIAGRNLPVDPRGFTAMVLYADAGQIALKYTWEDRVDTGYLLHLVNLCVDPNLVALYQRLNAAGRHTLPVVDNLSVIGTAGSDEVHVVVRDSGSFLDPRSWQDWWQDQPPPSTYGK